MTRLRRGATAREFILAVLLLAVVGAVLYFSGGLQFTYDFITELLKVGKETASNVADVIESEKSPRVAASVEGGLDDYRVVVTLKKAPGELKRVRATVTAHSPGGSRFAQDVEWDTWNVGEEKAVPVGAMTIKSLVFEGTATHDGKEIKIWPDVNKLEWRPPYPMPVLDRTRFDLRLVGPSPAKEFRIRSLQPFELKSVDLTIRSIGKGGESKEGKVARDVWRTDEEIVSELPDPNYRRITLDGTAEVRGKTVRVAVGWVRDDK